LELEVQKLREEQRAAIAHDEFAWDKIPASLAPERPEVER
jgi:hypothetical protein